jgi:hypothetical protein
MSAEDIFEEPKLGVSKSERYVAASKKNTLRLKVADHRRWRDCGQQDFFAHQLGFSHSLKAQHLV